MRAGCGARPPPGRVPRPATRGIHRPFQRRRNATQGPAENPAAPNQQHHLVIVLTDQFPDPLTGRDATGSGVDFPAARHDARHDTTPVEPGPRRRRAPCSPFLAPIGRDRGGTSLLQGLVDLQNALFTWSTSSAADGGQCIKSLIGGFSRFRSDFAFANPGKQAKAPESSGSRSAFFLFPRGPELAGHKTGCDGLEKSPPARAARAEEGRRQGPIPKLLCRTFRPTQAVYERLFSRDRPKSAPEEIRAPTPGALASRPNALRASLRGRMASQGSSALPFVGGRASCLGRLRRRTMTPRWRFKTRRRPMRAC